MLKCPVGRFEPHGIGASIVRRGGACPTIKGLERASNTPRQARKTRSTRGSKVDLMELAGAAAKLPHKGAEYMENAKTRKAQGARADPKRPSAVDAL